MSEVDKEDLIRRGGLKSIKQNFFVHDDEFRIGD